MTPKFRTRDVEKSLYISYSVLKNASMRQKIPFLYKSGMQLQLMLFILVFPLVMLSVNMKKD